MHAYIDDSVSQTGDRVLWMAGYLNAAADWALFSEAWNDELKVDPKIDYLKMSEALHFKEQFEGWTPEQRNEKLRGLARVIRHFQPMSFGMSVSVAKFDQHIASENRPYGLDAYYVASHLVIQKVADYAVSRRLIPPVDFFFDKHDKLAPTVQLFRDAMVEDMPRHYRGMVGEAFFRDDKLVLPIQAADMLAWYLRRNDEGSDSSFLKIELPQIVGTEHFESHVPEDVLKEWGIQFAKFPKRAMPSSEGRWKRYTRELRVLKDKGFIPPYGSKWRNRIARWFGYPKIPR